MRKQSLTGRERLLQGQLIRPVHSPQFALFLEKIEALPEKVATRPNSPDRTDAPMRPGEFVYGPPQEETLEEQERWFALETTKYRTNSIYRIRINGYLCDALLRSHSVCELRNKTRKLLEEMIKKYPMEKKSMDTQKPKWAQVDVETYSGSIPEELEKFLTVVRAWSKTDADIEQAVAEWRSQHGSLISDAEQFDLLQSPLLLTLTQERTRLSIQAQNLWESLPPDMQRSALAKSEREAKRAKQTALDHVRKGVQLFPANEVNTSAIWAIMKIPWEPAKRPGFTIGTEQNTNNAEVFFGVRDGDYTEQLGEYLAKGGVSLIKAHYAMWGLWYEQGAKPGDYVTVSLPALCDRLGYKQHHNGGHRKENKRRVVETLTALTKIELEAVQRLPGQGAKGKDKMRRLRGPLWQRGFLAEEKEVYDDLFGAAREGDPTLWEPKTYSFAPGAWFSDEAFRTYAKAVGKIGSGLLTLDNDKDQWAIKIGGYLGTILRAGQYAPRILRVETILQRANIAQTSKDRKEGTRSREGFERALDRLVEVEVIERWSYTNIDITEPDFDNIKALAVYGADESTLYQGNEWRAKKVSIELPNLFEVEAIRLATQKAKQVKLVKQRSANLQSDKSQENLPPTDAD